jgi:hypothetical protein
MIRLKSLLKEQDPKDIQSAVTFAQDVVKWLDKCSNSTPDARKWKLVNGFVDVEGDFDCSKQGLRDLKGVRFGVVTGDFLCDSNQLTSLEGAPQQVGGDFSCGFNQLTSLKGAPQQVGGDFFCAARNPLTSLKGAPKTVGRYFYYPKALGTPEQIKLQLDQLGTKVLGDVIGRY